MIDMVGTVNVMIEEYTAFGRSTQPNSVDGFSYRIRMPKTDSKTILWENVSRLMHKRYGKDNLTKLASEAKIGPGTSTRIKEQKTSVGTDILDQIAEVFGLQTWQLLVPNLDTEALPSLGGDSAGWPMHLVNKERYLSLSSEARVFVQGYLARVIEEQETMENRKSA